MGKTLLKGMLASIIGIAFLSGCTGSEVSPGNATQAGAATGALTGAVIGYNTKGHHKGTRMALGAALGAAIGGGAGYAIDENNPRQTDNGGWQ
jgi:hypothetical protein